MQQQQGSIDRVAQMQQMSGSSDFQPPLDDRAKARQEAPARPMKDSEVDRPSTSRPQE
jgi:hypothetical protein